MQTTLSQIEIAPDGTVSVRLSKPGIDDARQAGYHRTVIPPGVDPVKQLDVVDANLQAMGYPALDDRSMILAACTTYHTPARVVAYAAKMEEQIRSEPILRPRNVDQ